MRDSGVGNIRWPLQAETPCPAAWNHCAATLGRRPEAFQAHRRWPSTWQAPSRRLNAGINRASHLCHSQNRLSSVTWRPSGCSRLRPRGNSCAELKETTVHLVPQHPQLWRYEPSAADTTHEERSNGGVAMQGAQVTASVCPPRAQLFLLVVVRAFVCSYVCAVGVRCVSLTCARPVEQSNKITPTYTPNISCFSKPEHTATRACNVQSWKTARQRRPQQSRAGRHVDTGRQM